MLLALSAASSAIDALLGLTSPKQAKPAGSNGQSMTTFQSSRARSVSSVTSRALVKTRSHCRLVPRQVKP